MGDSGLRYAGMPWRLNVHVPGPLLRERWPLTSAAMLRLDDEVYAGKLTRRGAVRVHRVAWSVADLAGVGPTRSRRSLTSRFGSDGPTRCCCASCRSLSCVPPGAAEVGLQAGA